MWGKYNYGKGGGELQGRRGWQKLGGTQYILQEHTQPSVKEVKEILGEQREGETWCYKE